MTNHDADRRSRVYRHSVYNLNLQHHRTRDSFNGARSRSKYSQSLTVRLPIQTWSCAKTSLFTNIRRGCVFNLALQARGLGRKLLTSTSPASVVSVYSNAQLGMEAPALSGTTLKRPSSIAACVIVNYHLDPCSSVGIVTHGHFRPLHPQLRR
ncbi:hypothetical protein K443DRAFT_5197 [Laccaria amethystina LaAM-08-1]|uniref:Uncharacterized protein n=1 Tax=Laccaria amethystina LaAM-08-1 TaxID=1095629 RepID=A0A0C9Y120_9AGAR|nr:hypothetical protein K443DRAFT_5197 [Laccaria amethystina LaAM-08-1]